MYFLKGYLLYSMLWFHAVVQSQLKVLYIKQILYTPMAHYSKLQVTVSVCLLFYVSRPILVQPTLLKSSVFFGCLFLVCGKYRNIYDRCLEVIAIMFTHLTPKRLSDFFYTFFHIISFKGALIAVTKHYMVIKYYVTLKLNTVHCTKRIFYTFGCKRNTTLN